MSRRSWISGSRGDHEANVTPLTKNTRAMATRAGPVRPAGGSVGWDVMAAVTVYHNPRCSTSRAALAVAEELGVEVDVVRYLDDPPDAATLREIVAKLEDPVVDLVRAADGRKAGIDVADLATADAVIEVLVAHPELLQRPVLVTRRAGDHRPPQGAGARLLDG